MPKGKERFGKSPVTARALIQRINRKLKSENEAMKQCRASSPSWTSLGDYYVIDTKMNAVVRVDVDIEAFAKTLGVLKGWEQLAEE